MEVKRLVTHPRPHADEIAAFGFLYTFGEELFPGVKEAEIGFDGQPGLPYQGRSAEEWEKEGVLLVGAGGGRFDEHRPGENGGRLGKECAATLVARVLGLENDPSIGRLLKRVAKNDQNGGGDPLGLPQVAVLLHEEHPDDPKWVCDIIWHIMRAFINRHYSFTIDTEKEYRAKAREECWRGPKGQLRVVIVESDDDQIAKYARSAKGCKAQVVIVRRSTGHVQIFTDTRAGLEKVLPEAVKILRLEEQRIRGRIVIRDPELLGAEGSTADLPWWYLNAAAGWIFNGSRSASAPATALPFEQVVGAIRLGLNPRFFERRRHPNCLRGLCTDSQENPCPWHNYGLERCTALEREKAA